MTFRNELLTTRLVGIVSFCLGVLYLVSSVRKASNSSIFLAQLFEYHLFNGDAAITIAMVLPWLECVLASALITGFLRSGALVLSAFLGFGFLGVQLFAKWQSLHISCGCFGIGSERPVGAFSLMIAFFVAASSVVAYWQLSRIRFTT